jgi:hypothetical protein
MRAVIGVEDGGDVGGDLAFEILPGDVLLGVLLEVELAALPGCGLKTGLECGTQPGVRVGGDQI